MNSGKSSEQRETPIILEDESMKKGRRQSPRKAAECNEQKEKEFEEMLEEMDAVEKSPVIEQFDDDNSSDGGPSGNRQKRKREKSKTPPPVIEDSDDDGSRPMSNKRRKPTTTADKRAVQESVKRLRSPVVVKVVKDGDSGNTSGLHSVSFLIFKATVA